ncbi:hypothetical protein K461DRAFT_270308 [Myriangium duriaei CBS 260.36]|uniref:Uncharacterized protein n=1 Tax=Myriangium duriaei CBS 260.36 TaxID=1168546 RepID=A0A9P4MDA8_9PEZI|nr:hypothetical protein K461DRAFT_270308 [Myriangium duriaei CBS 260.36]
MPRQVLPHQGPCEVDLLCSRSGVLCILVRRLPAHGDSLTGRCQLRWMRCSTMLESHRSCGVMGRQRPPSDASLVWTSGSDRSCATTKSPPGGPSGDWPRKKAADSAANARVVQQNRMCAQVVVVHTRLWSAVHPFFIREPEMPQGIAMTTRRQQQSQAR